MKSWETNSSNKKEKQNVAHDILSVKRERLCFLLLLPSRPQFSFHEGRLTVSIATCLRNSHQYNLICPKVGMGWVLHDITWHNTRNMTEHDLSNKDAWLHLLYMSFAWVVNVWHEFLPDLSELCITSNVWLISPVQLVLNKAPSDVPCVNW